MHVCKVASVALLSIHLCAKKYILYRTITVQGSQVKLNESSENSYRSQCVQHGKLHHPIIVKMLGVCYLSEQAVLPVLVMELMNGNLKTMLDRCQNIPIYSKLSILKDVRGV